MQNNKPIDVMRDGNLKASIWENTNEKGPYFTTTFARSYRDEKGDWHDTQTFFRSDLLRISELGRRAYGRIDELAREHRQSQNTDHARESFKEQRRQDGNGGYEQQHRQ